MLVIYNNFTDTKTVAIISMYTLKKGKLFIFKNLIDQDQFMKIRLASVLILSPSYIG